MRALVTGACGFVGKYLIRHLQECGDEVLGTVNPHLSAHGKCNFPNRAADISDPEACAHLIAEYRPEVIYHLAGLAFVPDSENDFRKALLVNVGGTHNVYRVAHLMQQGIKILLVSSGEVYGRVREDELPLSERSRVDPANNYSLSKLMAEQVARRFEQHGYISSVIARPFNHIGPGQDLRFVASSFASQLAEIAGGKREPVIRVGNLEARRDFSDVRDMVKAYRLAMVKGQGVYNFGAGKSRAIRELLDSLIEISGVPVEVSQDPARMRPSEVPEVVSDCSKALHELGWRAEIPLEQTLRDIYEEQLALSAREIR